MDELCCPDWGYGKKHAPNCYYGEETWPRVFRAAINALSDWSEKRLLLAGSAEEPKRPERKP